MRRGRSTRAGGGQLDEEDDELDELEEEVVGLGAALSLCAGRLDQAVVFVSSNKTLAELMTLPLSSRLSSLYDC